MPNSGGGEGAELFHRLLPTRNRDFRELLQTVEKILDHDVNLLLQGESGTGKDYLAEAIHRCSRRSSRPFVRIDCASIPAELFESELFGYERGTFTDARTRKEGRLEMARGGTVYFDQIAALTPQLQAKLLRAIQEKGFTRLGGNQLIRLEARIISSTNADLQPLLLSGEFRSDLFYRLNVVSVTLPPLRTRSEDIPSLSRRLLKEAARRHGRSTVRIHPGAMELLRGYDWPGNVRELQSVLDRALLLEQESLVTADSLPADKFRLAEPLTRIAAARSWTLEELEKSYISLILRRAGYNYSKAAEILGINRKTLLEKRKRYGLD